ncbi:MAG TPA: hypothetical protein VKB46_26285 [Pyrinomonadaceae bacterium]|nr:hypothetical protein [Pyrinomonadaceae bacterium]
MKTFWILLAATCGVAATVLAVLRDFDKAFIVATIGAVCWFLNYRTQMKAILPNTEEEQEPLSDESDEI